MAESILTSINLAGGSFNVYYDTVLSIVSISSYNNRTNQCPTGWKAAILTAHSRHLNVNDDTGIMLSPMVAFNLNKQINYYATYLNVDKSILDVSIALTVNISNFSFGAYNDYHALCTGTVIFVA